MILVLEDDAVEDDLRQNERVENEPLTEHLEFFFLMILLPPRATLFPYTTLFRSHRRRRHRHLQLADLAQRRVVDRRRRAGEIGRATSELQSHLNLVCRLLLEKKKKKKTIKLIQKKKKKKKIKHKH